MILEMNRLLSCFTRGFSGLRSRPPPPSQSSSPCNDDNDNTRQRSEKYEIFHAKESQCSSNCNRLLLIPENLTSFESWKNKRRYHKNQENSFHNSIATESIISKVASALFLGQIIRYFTTIASTTFEEKKHQQKLNVLTKLNKIFVEPSVSTIQSILPHFSFSSVPLLKSNVHAAGEGKFSTEHRSVTKINSTSELETSQQDKSLIDDEHLEEFMSSVKESVGMAYNLQGIKEYKARNFFKAFRLFELGSQSGTKQAQFNLAICYQQGKGTKRNMKKAKKEYIRAACQGHEKAQYNLALILIEEQNLISFKRALFFLEKSAENGIVQAQTLAGAYYAQEGIHQNMKKAVKMFQLAADQQDTLSTYHLAECYEHGLGGLKVDTSRAFELYAAAASQGHQEAHFKMALILLSDCPEIEKNEELALEILKKAKELGHEESAKKYDQLMNAHKLQDNDTTSINHSSLFNSVDISQFVFPGLLQKLCPSTNVREHNIVTPVLSYNGLPSSVYTNHLHRVSTWPAFGQSLVSFSHQSK